MHLLAVLSLIVLFLFPAVVCGQEKIHSLLLVADIDLALIDGETPQIEACFGAGYQRLWRKKYITSFTLGFCPQTHTSYLSVDFLDPLGQSGLMLGPVVQLVVSLERPQWPEFSGGLELVTGPKWYHPSLLLTFGQAGSANLSAVWSPTVFDW